MKKEKEKRIQDAFFYLFMILMIGGCITYFALYRHADGKVVEALPSESDYPVYSGKNVYEHWKTTLDSDEQILYEEIKESFLQFKSDFSTQLKSITNEQMSETYSAVLLDHPEIFWMRSYNAVPDLMENINTRKNIQLVYAYDVDEAKDIKNKLELNYSKIIEGAKEQPNDFKKIKYVHDKIIEMSTYTKYTEEELHEYQSIVSIFEEGKTVCAGHAYGFKFIMDQLGIESIVSRDISNEDQSKNHIWNMVNLYGKWYNIDITYDSQMSEGNVIAYNYFLKSNEDFYTNHRMQKNIPKNEE